jgi:ABC-2 type transport system ATP-binding protein
VAAHGGESRLQVEGPFGDAGDVVGRLGFPAALDDGRLTVRDVPPEAIGDVVGTLADAGIDYESLTWTEPDLEDVYLELTGQAVGEGGEAVAGAGDRRGEEVTA